MFNLISALLNLFRATPRRPSVSDIIGDMESTTERLYKCADSRAALAAKERAEAAKLLTEAQDDEAEANRSRNVARNIERILGTDN